MPIDDLTALGQKMREARKNKELTQQELSDLSHVSVKQIANIEKGKMNPSYLILKALAKVLLISLDSLINPDISPEDEGANQMKIHIVLNCIFQTLYLAQQPDRSQWQPHRANQKCHD